MRYIVAVLSSPWSFAAPIGEAVNSTTASRKITAALNHEPQP